MKMPRLTIGRLMITVGVVAIDIAAARWLYNPDDRMLASYSLGVVAVQFSAFRMTRGQGRAFWLGFFLFSTAALVSLAAHSLIQPSLMTRLWSYYFIFAMDGLKNYPSLPQLVPPDIYDSPAIWIATALIAFIPQLVVALIGGFLAAGLSRLASGRTQSDREETRSNLGQMTSF